MLPLPSKEELEVVEKERSQESHRFTSGYLDPDNPHLYTDKKGLVHNGGPTGQIVSYIGLTQEQLNSAGKDGLMPMPR